MKKVIGSISGGETSGMLAKILKDLEDHGIIDCRYVFMNTGQEDERTLVFLDRLDKYFGLNLVWLEAVINPIKGKGITHKIVTFETACRDGSVFESHIAKYGIPSTESPHCTRDLKGACCNSYIKSIGWTDYEIAIGYRFDEPKRVNFIKAKQKKQWYPLYEKKIIKKHVKRFWNSQPFRLGLKEFEGNCKMCFKKSKRKLLTQMLTNPDSIQWIVDMELKYPNNPNTGEKVYFFRGKESIFDLIEQSKEKFDLWVEPVNSQTELFDIEMDEQESCESSCEPFPIDEIEYEMVPDKIAIEYLITKDESLLTPFIHKNINS